MYIFIINLGQVVSGVRIPEKTIKNEQTVIVTEETQTNVDNNIKVEENIRVDKNIYDEEVILIVKDLAIKKFNT